ncbi:MAG: histidine phosphatase family protein [Gammaproteobacteria bacterium]|jgi:phosphohistidine phosphatase
MSRELFILRHAKSDWGSDVSQDQLRPLNKRGRRDAPRIGAWLREHYLYPGWIYCSTAVRARETLDAIEKELQLPHERIVYAEMLYLASVSTLLAFLRGIPVEQNSVMLVGHNPGLDDLVNHLSSEKVPLTDSGKLMTTACLVRFKLPDDWKELAGKGELMQIIRPAELD